MISGVLLCSYSFSAWSCDGAILTVHAAVQALDENVLIKLYISCCRYDFWCHENHSFNRSLILKISQIRSSSACTRATVLHPPFVFHEQKKNLSLFFSWNKSHLLHVLFMLGKKTKKEKRNVRLITCKLCISGAVRSAFSSQSLRLFPALQFCGPNKRLHSGIHAAKHFLLLTTTSPPIGWGKKRRSRAEQEGAEMEEKRIKKQRRRGKKFPADLLWFVAWFGLFFSSTSSDLAGWFCCWVAVSSGDFGLVFSIVSCVLADVIFDFWAFLIGHFSCMSFCLGVGTTSMVSFLISLNRIFPREFWFHSSIAS